MKLTRQWIAKYPVHFCMFDKQCRKYGAPRRVYFHFLKKSDGSSFYIAFRREDW